MDVTFRRLARLWSILFALAALDFLLEPRQLGRDLTAAANALGLPGAIETDGGRMWWVLALSLLAALAVLARRLARDPRDAGAWQALCTAKVTSSAAFGVLALEEPAWALCAAVDLLAVGSLAWARGGERDVAARYLRFMGIQADITEYEREVRLLPAHVRPLHRLARAALTWLAPLLLTGAPRTAGALDDPSFDALCRRLTHHPLPAIRLSWLLVRAPSFGLRR